MSDHTIVIIWVVKIFFVQFFCVFLPPLDWYLIFATSGNTLNSVQSSHSVVSNSLQSHGLQCTRPPCPSPTPRVYSNSHPLSQWCCPTISFSVVSSSDLQSFPALGSFQVSQPIASGGQTIGVSASTSVLQVNTQDWFPFGWTGWISLQFKGLSRVFSEPQFKSINSSALSFL